MTAATMFQPKRALGLDGCKAGWVAAWVDSDGRTDFSVLPRIDGIEAIGADAVMIDMPIGLPESGYRACDRAARRSLGEDYRKVFLGVRRPLLGLANDYSSANRWAKRDGAGISKQLFCILPKVSEVDAYIAANASRRLVFETHPELIFRRLNDGKRVAGKKTSEGVALRVKLLQAAGFNDISDWLETLRGTGAKPDDLLDACACSLAARDKLLSRGRRLECQTEVDSKGLTMEMWY